MDLAADGPARRRAIAIGIVLAGLVLLIGVVIGTAVDRGSGSPLEGVDPVAALRAAPDKLDKKRVRAEIAVGTAGALQLQVTQAGVFDIAAGQVDVTVTGIGPSPLRVVTDGRALYVQSSSGFSGKPWGRLAPEEAGPISQVSGAQLSTLLTVLRGTRMATDRGVESLGTVRVRRLSTVVSAQDLATISPLFAQLGASSAAPLDVLLDGDGVPRKIDVTSEAGATKVHIRVTLSDVGKPGPVQVPRPEETVDVGLDDLSVLVGR